MAEEIIAIAGGIGSGTSLVGKILREKGYCVLDADCISRDVVKPGSPALREIADTFGKKVIRSDGTLDRSLLAAEVFSDGEKLSRLNAILHPVIADEIFRRAADCRERLAFVEIPLITQTEFAGRFDRIWCVTAPKELRLKRAAQRDGCSPEQIERRMAQQPAQEEVIAISDAVLHNVGSREDLEREVGRLLKEYGASAGK